MRLSIIRNAQRSLYYSQFRWQRKLWFGRDSPAYILAVGGVWFLQCLNLITLVILIHAFAHLAISDTTRQLMVASAATLFPIYFWRLASNGKWKEIVSNYQGKDAQTIRLIDRWGKAYSLGSLVLYILTNHLAIHMIQLMISALVTLRISSRIAARCVNLRPPAKFNPQSA